MTVDNAVKIAEKSTEKEKTSSHIVATNVCHQFGHKITDGLCTACGMSLHDIQTREA